MRSAGCRGGTRPSGVLGLKVGHGRVEPECAEAATTEEAVIACHRSLARSTLGQDSPHPLLSSDFVPGDEPATWLDHAIRTASRQGRFRKWRSSFFTGWSRVPLAPKTRGAESALAKISADGTRAHSPARRLPADVREQVSRLLLAGPSGGAGDRLHPRRGRRDLARDRPRALRRRDRAPLPRRDRHLDADRVLAAPARLPLAAEVPAAATASTSSSTASTTTTPTTPCGWSCPRRSASRSPPSSSGSTS